MTPSPTTTTSPAFHPEADSLKGSTLHEPHNGTPTPAPKEPKTSWRHKLHRSAPEEPGKEKWRDATLSEKERWKDWQKAKDREQARGSAAGSYAQFYKGKGSWGYWLAALW